MRTVEGFPKCWSARPGAWLALEDGRWSLGALPCCPAGTREPGGEGEPGDERSEGVEPGSVELGDPLRRGEPVLKADPEQDWVLGYETAEHSNAGFDKVCCRVVGLGQGPDGRAEHLKSTRAQGDQQAGFGAEQAVDGPGGGLG